MKKIFTILALAGVVLSANAQKAKVNQAKNAVLLQKVDDAKNLIDEALQHEKTNSLPNTYLVAADVYANVALKKVDAEAFTKAKEFMAKAEELDAKGDAKGKGIGKAQKDIKKAYADLLNVCQNVGVAGFNAKNYGLAKEAFLYSCTCQKNSMGAAYTPAADSLLLLNAGIAAIQQEDFATAADCFTKTFEYDYDGALSIQRVHYCYSQLNDTANMEIALKKGFEKYPAEKQILLNLIQFYLNAQRNEDALIYLNEAIAKDETNPLYYYARGCLNEKIDMEKAIADYNKALSLNDKHYNSLYNLAVIYFNKGLDIRNEASNERDDKKYAALMVKVQETMSQAKPYIERAVEASENTEIKIETLKTMKQICYNADPEDKDGKWSWANKLLRELEQ
ncbi:MAG: hypothetical protein MJZ18_03815 [Bacteroidales bacterium]|nr:hypothetical protein [Bacteroidales bacterium]